MAETKYIEGELRLRNLEAEQAVLGAMLTDPLSVYEIRTIISTTDFAWVTHRKLFDAMLAVSASDRALDFVTLGDEIRRRGQMNEIGHSSKTGESYLVHLTTTPYTSVHAVDYAKTVRQLSVRRQLLDASRKIAKLTIEAKDSDKAIAQAFGFLEKVNATITTGLQSTSELVADFISAFSDWAENPSDVWGHSTGLRDLDRLTGGLERGELVILSVRPSLGKSAMALQIARNVAEHHGLVIFFSMEMSKKQLIMRLACGGARIDSDIVRRGRLTTEGYNRFMDEISCIDDLSIKWQCEGGLDIHRAINMVAQERARGDVAMVVFDYLQLMEASGENQNVRVSNISRGLKKIATKFDTCVLALSQLSRRIEYGAARQPKLSDLRDSGSLEQDADKVIFLHRDEVENIIRVILAKNRNGLARTSVQDLVFLETYAIFADKAHEAP